MKTLYTSILAFLLLFASIGYAQIAPVECPVSGEIDTIEKVENAIEGTLPRYNAWDDITSPLTVSLTAKEGCTINLLLASYTTQGPTWETSFPQTVYKSDIKTLTGGETYTFSVDVPECYYQVDFVVDSELIPSYSDETNDPYGVYGNDKLIAWGNGGHDCTPPVDMCPNIEGDQATVPEGKELVDGQCVDIVIQPTDLCTNIDGDQETVPEGMEEHDGVCAVPEDQSGGSHHHSSHSSSSSTSSSPISLSPVILSCALPVALTGFDVQSAIPNDGQNELVWNINNSYVVQEGDKFNPFTGILIENPVVGSVLYGTNVTSVNIRWWEYGTTNYLYTTSNNDGFEAITGLGRGIHHWFQLQPVNNCGVGDWGVAIDPIS